jgi:hypothetical protein
MAALLGETVGETVGYKVRLDSRVSAATQIEVVTEGTWPCWANCFGCGTGTCLILARIVVAGTGNCHFFGDLYLC